MDFFVFQTVRHGRVSYQRWQWPNGKAAETIKSSGKSALCAGVIEREIRNQVTVGIWLINYATGYCRSAIYRYYVSLLTPFGSVKYSLYVDVIYRFTVTSIRTTNDDIIKDWAEIRLVTTDILKELNIRIADRAKVPLKGKQENSARLYVYVRLNHLHSLECPSTIIQVTAQSYLQLRYVRIEFDVTFDTGNSIRMSSLCEALR